MGKFGTGELLLILVIALVIFGPAKLPALGKMAGKAVGSFRHYVSSADSWDLEEELTRPAPAQASATATADPAPAAQAEQTAPPAEQVQA